MKTQLAAFDSMFAGYEQQDASEALAKILEGVGEDVNRIGGAEKPYTELPDSAGRADKEVASEWWAAHEAREKHVVTALMTGQLKVTTTCSATQVASTTFEQFVSLAVPLPEDNRLFFTVVVVFSTATTTAALLTLEAAGCDTPIAPSSSAASLPLSTSPVSNRRPLRCAVAVPQDGTVATLLAEIANLLNGRPGGGRGGDSETAEGMVAAYVGTDHFITSVLPADKALALLHPDALLHVFRVGIPPLPVPPPPLVEGDKVEIWSGLSWREAVVSRGPVKVLLKEGEQSLDRAGERIERGPVQDVGAPLVQSTIERKEEDEEVECRDENGMVWTASVSLGSVRRLRDTPVLLLMCLRVQVSVARFFVDPHRLELFGRPFVLRVVPDLTTGRDLYSSVWAHVGQLFDTLEELPESNGRFKFRVRRVSKGHTIGPDGSLAGGQGTGAVAVAGGLNPLLVPGGQVIPADVVPLRVQDEEVLLVDVPAEWLACFNRRAAAYVEEDASISQLNEERCRPVNLVQCLRSLCEPEEVTAFSPALTRMRGGEYSEAKQSKCSQLWHPPPVLVIVLKRFRLTPSGAKHKLSTPVVFPLEGLDFAEFMDSSRVSKEVRHGDAVYDLAAVVNHIGSLGGGHYTCFAKRHRRRRDGEGSDGQSDQETHSEPAWALFDDSRVATVDDLDRIISPQVLPSNRFLCAFTFLCALTSCSSLGIRPRL
jgi:ubiquitin C-terminal hydrolase